MTGSGSIRELRVHVIADAEDRDGGHVVERLEQLNAEIVQLDRDDLPTYDSIGGSALTLLLGSRRSAHDPRWIDVVDAESHFVRSALRDSTPVIGICYGAQLMARALGGNTGRAAQAEIGWRSIVTTDALLCPEGPWAQLHRDTFVPPPGARILGRSPVGAQCFIDDSHGARAIAWQFHPEVTARTYSRWIREVDFGLSNGDKDELIREAIENEGRSRIAAHRLTDSALDYLGVITRGVAPSTVPCQR